LANLPSLIAIVEDDHFVRGSIRRLVKSFGYAAEEFPSANDFLAFPRRAETACLIADINMPGMTGVELYRRLVKAGHPIPTILITAYPDDAIRARALKDGVLCYLHKPCDDDELLRCVRRALDRVGPKEGS
jgi:FixJ family two-component response regulator